MTDTAHECLEILNNLVETCKDGQKGYRTAAEGVKSPDLKRLLNELSLERARFAGDLQGEVTRLGGDPAKSGSTGGALHRGWLNLKKAVTGSSDHAILEECERGEDSAIQDYRKALSKELPSDLRSIVERQYVQIQKDHHHVRTLRDTAVVEG